MTALDPIDQAHGVAGLARIGSALVHACAADPLLPQKLPRRVIDALELHDAAAETTNPPIASRPVLGRVLSYQRSRA